MKRALDDPAGERTHPQLQLKLAIDTLLKDLLPQLERNGQDFYDAIEGALDPTTDARTVAAKRTALISSLDELTDFLQRNGLASLPLQPSPPASLEPETQQLQDQAREMFERRARLREGAAIVGGILTESTASST